MRSFIVLLLLIVVFLSGMLIGMDKKESSLVNHLPIEGNVIEQADWLSESEAYEKQLIVEEEMIEFDFPEQNTQKIAMFLEAGVKAFMKLLLIYYFKYFLFLFNFFHNVKI